MFFLPLEAPSVALPVKSVCTSSHPSSVDNNMAHNTTKPENGYKQKIVSKNLTYLNSKT